MTSCVPTMHSLILTGLPEVLYLIRCFPQPRFTKTFASDGRMVR